MIRIQTNISKAVRRLEMRRVRIGRVQQFLKRKQPQYHQQAVELTYQTVYVDFPESDYERTGNLLQSVNAETIEEGNTMRIFIDPARANIAAASTGTYRYYPSYVLRGIFSWRGVKYPGPRLFLDAWYRVIGKRFIRDAQKEFRRAIEVK